MSQTITKMSHVSNYPIPPKNIKQRRAEPGKIWHQFLYGINNYVAAGFNNKLFPVDGLKLK